MTDESISRTTRNEMDLQGVSKPDADVEDPRQSQSLDRSVSTLISLGGPTSRQGNSSEADESSSSSSSASASTSTSVLTSVLTSTPIANKTNILPIQEPVEVEIPSAALPIEADTPLISLSDDSTQNSTGSSRSDTDSRTDRLSLSSSYSSLPSDYFNSSFSSSAPESELRRSSSDSEADKISPTDEKGLASPTEHNVTTVTRRRTHHDPVPGPSSQNISKNKRHRRPAAAEAAASSSSAHASPRQGISTVATRKSKTTARSSTTSSPVLAPPNASGGYNENIRMRLRLRLQKPETEISTSKIPVARSSGPRFPAPPLTPTPIMTPTTTPTSGGECRCRSYQPDPSRSNNITALGSDSSIVVEVARAESDYNIPPRQCVTASGGTVTYYSSRVQGTSDFSVSDPGTEPEDRVQNTSDAQTQTAETATEPYSNPELASPPTVSGSVRSIISGESLPGVPNGLLQYNAGAVATVGFEGNPNIGTDTYYGGFGNAPPRAIGSHMGSIPMWNPLTLRFAAGTHSVPFWNHPDPNDSGGAEGSDRRGEIQTVPISPTSETSSTLTTNEDNCHPAPGSSPPSHPVTRWW